MSFSPFPADLRISPVSQDFSSSWVSAPWDHALVETLEPVGHIRLDFEVDDLRLGSRPTQLTFEMLQLQERIYDNSIRNSNHK